ncbi:toprim domain-containing protein [Methylobacterium sp. J-059]|uniref:DUF7146 domain-containing protein n=1 Tax=Methylobacterium sp. J-059 TaxID=2836643 RepID=UPI001FB91A97|nr:toprim domain-containing protein [Methylobacterium sp. J-059]MCJ2039554.1 toprim domain-containing protein [Methylobacterium sp. J-059]
MTVSLAEIARALRGQVHGSQVLAPGPNHSAKDRSLSVRLSDGSADGFVVHSHAGDDWRTCRDHVADALGLSADRWRQTREPDPAEIERRRVARERAEAVERAAVLRRQRQARAIWDAGRNPKNTVVEAYLRSRCLDLPSEVAGDVIRFHPACAWGQETAPAMVAALRCVQTGDIVGVHRTALTPDGTKLGRKMLGTALGAAVMLDGEDTVTTGLTIGEGIESCLAARQIGLRPVWALGSTAGIAAFPLLPGIDALSLLGERDAGASDQACREVGTRWHRAGRAVDIVLPRVGKDMNDQIREGTPAWH